MLKTIRKSSNKKVGPCASTYRSGLNDVYSTCPSTCSLKPATSQGSASINPIYLDAVKNGVPKDGVAWTYTHFPRQELLRTGPGQTTINISTEHYRNMLDSYAEGFPTVIVAASEFTNKVDIVENIKLVRCPAEWNKDVTCFNCGGDTPLCSRKDRDYVIKFTAHGSGSKQLNARLLSISSTSLSESAGGCYGNSGPVRLQWEKTKGTTENDAEILTRFVNSLEPGTKLRHHVVGDLG